jgi:cystathionine beta-lyase
MVDADSAYVASRGLRTMGVRLKQHAESSLRIAEWLQTRPEVARVNHPALPGSKGHEFWKRDFTGSCGLFSFILSKRLTDDQLAHYLDHFEHFGMAYSWGGFGEEVDFTGTLVRVHIGLEHCDDLIADLEAAFARIA